MRHRCGSVADVFTSAVSMVLGLALTLAAFGGSSGCTFQIMGPVFLYFFQKFPKFSFWG